MKQHKFIPIETKLDLLSEKTLMQLKKSIACFDKSWTLRLEKLTVVASSIDLNYDSLLKAAQSLAY